MLHKSETLFNVPVPASRCRLGKLALLLVVFAEPVCSLIPVTGSFINTWSFLHEGGRDDERNNKCRLVLGLHGAVGNFYIDAEPIRRANGRTETRFLIGWLGSTFSVLWPGMTAFSVCSDPGRILQYTSQLGR